MRKILCTLLATGLYILPISTAVAQQNLNYRQPSNLKAAVTRPAPRVKQLLSLRGATGGGTSRVGIVSDSRLGNVLSFEKNGRFYVRIPDARAALIKSINLGFTDSQVEQVGQDVLISFTLEAGLTASVTQKFNQLEVLFAPAAVTPASTRQTASNATRARRVSRVDASAFAPATSLYDASATATNYASYAANDVRPATTHMSPVTAIAQTGCAANCVVPTSEKPRGRYAVIDANTGTLIDGSLRLPDGGKVIFVNKNPFKYTYSITIAETGRSSEAAVSGFLGFIFGDTLSEIGGNLESPGKTAEAKNALSGEESPDGSKMAPGGNTTPCNGKNDIEEMNRIAVRAEALSKEVTSLKDSVDAKTKAFNAVKKEYEEFITTTNADNISCPTVCTKAESLLPKLKKMDLGDLAKSITQTANRITAFSVRVDEFEGKDSSNPEACKSHVQIIYARVADALEGDIKKITEAHDALKKQIDDSAKPFDDLAKVINEVVSTTPSPFYEVRDLSGEDGDEIQYRATISRRNRRTPNAESVEVATKPELRVGQARIVLSAGVGFSTINEEKIIRQQSLVPGEGDDSTLGARFGFENRSKFRPSGVVMLNGILTRSAGASFGLGTGLVLSGRNDGIATEFLAGPTIGFINNRMFFTAGFHAARVEKLAGGFEIGDPVPDDLADPLPVEKNWRNGLMFALTFKFLSR